MRIVFEIQFNDFEKIKIYCHKEGYDIELCGLFGANPSSLKIFDKTYDDLKSIQSFLNEIMKWPAK